MKIKFNSLYAVAFMGLLSFASCKKDDAPTPTPPTPQPQPELVEVIQGKWVIDLPASARVKHPKVSAKTQEQETTYTVEFLSDNTFILDLGGYAFHRAFSIQDKVVSLDGLIMLSNVKRTDDNLSFKITFTDAFDEEFDDDKSGASINVTSTKVAAIQIPEDIKNITKKWYLDMNSDYENNYLLLLAEEAHANRVERLFTVNGTIYTEFFNNEERRGALTSLWKKHATQNGIVEYTEEEDITDEFYAVALTTSALDLKHYVAIEDDSVPSARNTEGGDGDDEGDDDAPDGFELKGTLSFSTEKPSTPEVRKR